MDQVIHRTQTYCVPGRSIVVNLSLILDVLEVSGLLSFDVGLISLDQEKAFDWVDHHYLLKVLERFGLSPGLITKIKGLNEDIESVLKISGGLCEPFKVTRGHFESDMSSMLYALSIEPVLHTARPFIDDLFLPDFNTCFILPAYADNIIIVKKQKGCE